jgi:Tn3 transposase DDE domain
VATNRRHRCLRSRWFALQEHGFPDFGYRLYRAPSKITTSLLSWDAVDIPRGSTTYAYSPEVLLKCAGFGVRLGPDYALEQTGNLEFTLFGFGYASDPRLRDAIHLMPQKQENYNGFKNRLFWFNKGEMHLTADHDIQNRPASIARRKSRQWIFCSSSHLQKVSGSPSTKTD